MSILSFQSFRKSRPEPAEAGWSQSDIAEFYRAHKLLNDQGILVGLDQGVTDEHEPWLVFYDHETHDVFLHIARIDGNCILLCEHLSINIRENKINALIQRFESTVRNLLDSRARQSSNVVVHPAARIITTVAAVFLLFKIENGRAQAKSIFGENKSENTEEGQLLVAETRLLNIHRTNLTRIFDTIDTPLHAAMMASFVVSNAIAMEKPSGGARDGNPYVMSVSDQKMSSLQSSTKDSDAQSIAPQQPDNGLSNTVKTTHNTSSFSSSEEVNVSKYGINTKDFILVSGQVNHFDRGLAFKGFCWKYESYGIGISSTEQCC